VAGQEFDMVGAALNMLMPLDKHMYQSRREDFKNRALWYVEFAWLPKRCWISNRLIWLEKAYQGTAMWTGPGEPIFEYHWVNKDEYLVAKIKGTL
jgi:hypothetical protein